MVVIRLMDHSQDIARRVIREQVGTRTLGADFL
jgi:hypothetical protein